MGSGLLSNILKHRTAWHIHIVENDDDNKDDDDTDYDCGGRHSDFKKKNESHQIEKFLKFQIWVKRGEDLAKMLWIPFEVSLKIEILWFYVKP